MTLPIERERTRGWLLSAWLIYVALSHLWTAYRSFEVYRDLVAHADPRFPHWPFLVLAVLALVNVLAVVGLWFWKRWGSVLFCVVTLAGLGVNIYLGVSVGRLLLSMIGVAITLAIFVPKWRRLN
jgi:Predicted membrane protein (DUF2127)